MSGNCFQATPLVRAGTEQAGRPFAALGPGYARLDDRAPADMIGFASDFARLLAYFDPDNRPSGDWSDFIDADISAVLARLILEGPRFVDETVDRHREELLEAASDADRRAAATALFGIQFSLFLALDRVLVASVAHPPMRSVAQREVRVLEDTLVEVLGTYAAGLADGLLEDPTTADPSLDRRPYTLLTPVLSPAVTAWRSLADDGSQGADHVSPQPRLADGQLPAALAHLTHARHRRGA